jgi:hypothetical protein
MSQFTGSVEYVHSWARLLLDALSPGRLFVAADYQLTLHSPKEENIVWEIFRGQLLDARSTRETVAFLSVHVTIRAAHAAAELPLLSFRFRPTPTQPQAATLYVTRWLRCWVWEATDEAGAISSRETERWIEELVGAVSIGDLNGASDAIEEMSRLAFHAFVGLSRLPLNSVESPLPAFSFGVAGFFPSLPAGEKVLANSLALLDVHPHPAGNFDVDYPRRVELFLRTADGATREAGARLFATQFPTDEPGKAAPWRILRRMFNDTSLTPYTAFVDNALHFARCLHDLVTESLENYASFLLHLIRQTVYHLTAYDLVTFHHQGANYPDALLLDALLRDVLALAKTHPKIFSNVRSHDDQEMTATRRRRRAFVLGWWMHGSLEGLAVPDAPTSPGENRRILSPPHQTVPEQQLSQPAHRTRRLFAERPLDWTAHRSLLDMCFEELADPAMLLELGTGLYLDRPFGVTKPPASLDLTPLLSYYLFSQKVAAGRLKRIAQLEPQLASKPEWGQALSFLQELKADGIIVPAPAGPSRTIRLQDCWRISDDFAILRATQETIRQLRTCFDWAKCAPPLKYWDQRRWLPVAIPGEGPGVPSRIRFYDSAKTLRAECVVAAEEGFHRRGAVELPMPGLSTVQDGERIVIDSRL